MNGQPSAILAELLDRLAQLPAGERALLEPGLLQLKDLLDQPSGGEAVYPSMILNHIHDAVVAMDGEMTITLWNRSAEQISGVSAAEALGRKFYELVRRPNATHEQREADRRAII